MKHPYAMAVIVASVLGLLLLLQLSASSPAPIVRPVRAADQVVDMTVEFSFPVDMNMAVAELMTYGVDEIAEIGTASVATFTIHSDLLLPSRYYSQTLTFAVKPPYTEGPTDRLNSTYWRYYFSDLESNVSEDFTQVGNEEIVAIMLRDQQIYANALSEVEFLRNCWQSDSCPVVTNVVRAHVTGPLSQLQAMPDSPLIDYVAFANGRLLPGGQVEFNDDSNTTSESIGRDKLLAGLEHFPLLNYSVAYAHHSPLYQWTSWVPYLIGSVLSRYDDDGDLLGAETQPFYDTERRLRVHQYWNYSHGQIQRLELFEPDVMAQLEEWYAYELLVGLRTDGPYLPGTVIEPHFRRVFNCSIVPATPTPAVSPTPTEDPSPTPATVIT